MDYTIIEPCCAERQVSRLLASEHKGRGVLMQTNGDVALKNWMQAILLLASGVRPRVMTLAIGEGLTQPVVKIAGKYLRLGWVAKLRLMTPTPLTEADIKRLADAVECEPQDLFTQRECSMFNGQCSIAPLELAAEWQSPQPGSFSDVLVMQGNEGTAIIQGRMTGTATNAFTLYAGLYGKPEAPVINNFLAPFNAHFKARRYDVSINGNDNGNENDQTTNPLND